MKLIELNTYDFKAELDNPKWLHSIKCVLLDPVPDPKYLTFTVKSEHLKPLFGSNDSKDMTAEVYDEEIFLELKIKTKGVYLECMYKIDSKFGTVEFEMCMPYLIRKEYVVPDDLEPELAKRVEKFMLKKFKMANFSDEGFNQYYAGKLMPVFFKYALYLEGLIREENCEGCVFLYQHRLSGVCNRFYKKNKCK